MRTTRPWQQDAIAAAAQVQGEHDAMAKSMDHLARAPIAVPAFNRAGG